MWAHYRQTQCVPSRDAQGPALLLCRHLHPRRQLCRCWPAPHCPALSDRQPLRRAFITSYVPMPQERLRPCGKWHGFQRGGGKALCGRGAPHAALAAHSNSNTLGSNGGTRCSLPTPCPPPCRRCYQMKRQLGCLLHWLAMGKERWKRDRATPGRALTGERSERVLGMSLTAMKRACTKRGEQRSLCSTKTKSKEP